MTGAELARARVKLGLTQIELADLLGCWERTVGGWEQGTRNGRPAPIPKTVELLMTVATRYKSARKALGLVQSHGDANVQAHRPPPGPPEDQNPAGA